MVKQGKVRVNDNVTHRVCTHRLVTAKMRRDATRYSHPIWPRHPPHPRGTEDQSGRRAERCGLHRTYYSGIERGVRNVSLVNIERIARGLRAEHSAVYSH